MDIEASKNSIHRLTFVCLAALVLATPSVAQWTGDTTTYATYTNISINSLKVMSDGSGGVYMVWYTQIHPFTTNDIYAQHINSKGEKLWGSDGVIVCGASGSQTDPAMASDGSGGLIIAWNDSRGSKVYVQRLNAAGNAQWAADGKVLSASDSLQTAPTVISDDSGGAIIVWKDLASLRKIMALRINGNGVALWPQPVLVNVGVSSFQQINAVKDGDGGAFLSWIDERSTFKRDVYAQRISKNGELLWEDNGVAISAGAEVGSSNFIDMTSDDSNGVVLTWCRNPSPLHVYVQRIRQDGSIVWDQNGLLVTSAANFFHDHQKIIGTDQGGAIVAWREEEYKICAQKINRNGSLAWTVGGITVCSLTGLREHPAITSDKAGGAIIAWSDNRYSNYLYETRTYAQRINSNGAEQWRLEAPLHGITVGQGSNGSIGNATFPEVVAEDEGGAIILFAGRSLQKIKSNGILDDVIPPNAPMNLITSDSTGQVFLRWSPNTEPNFLRYRIFMDTSPDPVTQIDSTTNGIADTSKLITGLTNETLYYFRIAAVDNNMLVSNYSTNVTAMPQQVTEPLAQPTNITFANVGQDSFLIQFSPAVGTPRGYLVVRKTGSSPTSIIMDSVVYGVGDVVGDGLVVHTGSQTTFVQRGLLPNTVYYYDIYAYNGSGMAIDYLNTSPLEGNRTTLVVGPGAQPTGLGFSNVAGTSMRLTFNPSVGGASGYLIVKKAQSSPNGIPTDGVNYQLGNSLGNGTIVYIGNQTAIDVTALQSSTKYYFDIFAFNGSDLTINYLQNAPLEGSRETLVVEPLEQPSNVIFSNRSSKSVDVAFTPPNSAASGYLVIRKTNSSPTGIPVDGTEYSVGQALDDGTVVYSGNANYFIDSTLNAETNYFYDIFSFNGNGVTINYKSNDPLEANQYTLAVNPIAQPTDLHFSNITGSSITLSFIPPNQQPSGYIIVRKVNSSPSANPQDGIFYSLAQNIGDAIVVYKGNATSFVDRNLSPAMTYFYDIYAYNGSEETVNYCDSLPLDGSVTTSEFLAPNILSTSVPEIVPEGTPIYVQATVSGTLPKVTLIYNRGNFVEGKQVEMSQTGNTYSATIPATDVTSVGVWTQIRAENTSDTVYFPSPAGRTNVAVFLTQSSVDAARYTGVFPNGVLPRTWNSISIPYNFQGAIQLEALLGIQNRNTNDGNPLNWSAYTYNPSNQILSPVTTLLPGNAYFIYHTRTLPMQFDDNLTSPHSNDLDVVQNFILNREWNFFAWPYSFVSSFTRDVTKIGAIWELVDNSWIRASEFKPYGAYMIYNKTGSELPFKDVVGLAFLGKNRSFSEANLTYHSVIRFSAQSSSHIDDYNFIGLKNDASSDYDCNDEIEPYNFKNGLQLSFKNEKNDLSFDCRSMSDTGNVWEMVVKSYNADKTILSWEQVEGSGVDATVMVDIANNKIINLSANRYYQFKAKKENVFKIISGSDEFVSKELTKIKALLPQSFTLKPNYPNPFNPKTKIVYELAKTVQVTLVVYNVLGQTVKILVDMEQSTGKHEIEWDGTDSDGNLVSSGIYFYRLMTPDFTQTRKMILMK